MGTCYAYLPVSSSFSAEYKNKKELKFNVTNKRSGQ